MATVADYLAGIGPDQRAAYEQIRSIVLAMVPDAEETISYGMPTLKYRGKYLIYVGAFTNHMSVFPGTIKFTPADPIPAATVEDLVRRRMTEIAG